MRLASILLSLAVAVTALVLPAAARHHYYKGLTTVADLESLRLLDDEGRFRKHTLVAFTLPDDGSSVCALEQLEALRFPHLFFHLPGTIFEMIQVFLDPDTELTQALLPKASHKDACRSFLFIPQNTTVAAAGAGADAEGRRLVAQSQRELEGWFWGLQCAATGPFAFKNDFSHTISIYRERPQARRLEMEFPKGDDARTDFGSKDARHLEEFVATVAPGERVVLNASNPICRGHTAVFRRFGGRMFARLVVGDENMHPSSFVPKSTNASEEEGGVTALGLRAKADPKSSAWDPRRLQLTDELINLYHTRREYNFKRLERIEHAPRRVPALTTEGFIKERLPQATWDVLVQKYDEAVEQKKHTPERMFARSLAVENVRVPLPTAVQRHRNSNPQPVTTLFGEYEEEEGREWQAMVEGVVPRIEAWLGRKDLEPTLLTNFRRYYNGSMLRDRMDGVGDVIVIVNMDQEVEEPWEIHILDHQGRRHRITMEPGEMIIYQPDRVAQGRPLPLAGQYYDNVIFRVKVEGMERRPVSPLEAGLGLLETHDLPSVGAAQFMGEGKGLMAEL